MNSHVALIRNSIWVIGGFGFSQALRLVSSIILARLLAPEIFGMMVIIYSIRGGIDLLSDIGIGQSIVANKEAAEPEFYNTAWTLRLLRGVLVLAFCLISALPISNFYDLPILIWIMPIVGLTFFVAGLGSLSPMFLQREMRTAELSIFEFVLEAMTSISQIAFALFNPTIWTFVFGTFFNSVARSIGSNVIGLRLRHRVFISKRFSKQIFKFGIWIFLSSLVYFLSANFDRLYLGKEVPFAILGIYGIAKGLADTANTLVSRLNFIIVFPFVASHSETPRPVLRQQVKFSRAILLLATAAGLATVVVLSDFIIEFLYDTRYRDAGWMLSVLSIGVWFSVLTMISESTLLGLGTAYYAPAANSLKLAWLIVGIPFCISTYGITGVVLVVLAGEIWRYIPIFIGQRREKFSFVGQDAAVTLLFFTLIIAGEWLRLVFGFHTSFAGMG